MQQRQSGLECRDVGALDLTESDRNLPSSEREDVETVFLLALEGGSQDPRWGFFERALDTLVKFCQPSPIFTHVEIFIPTQRKGGDVHFATYLGRHADWGSGFGSGKAFYCDEHNEARWRAIPVMHRGALHRLHKECAREADAQTAYSLTGYLFSIPPLWVFSALRPNSVGSPAHCAALSARVLDRALPSLKLPHSDSSYGPSTLYAELATHNRMREYDEYLTDTKPAVLSVVEKEEIDNARETLLSGTDEEVRRLSTRDCNLGIAAQSDLVIRERAASSVEANMSVLERGLARMLLRWSILQNQT